MPFSDPLCGKRLHASDALLDIAKFSAVGAIVGFSGQSSDFLRNGFGAVSRIRVVAEKLRTTRAAFLLQLGKKIGHGLGIKSGVIHDVGTEQVSFGFGLPRILQEIGADAK